MKLTKNQQMLLGAAALVAVGVYLYRRNQNGNGGNGNGTSNFGGRRMVRGGRSMGIQRTDLKGGVAQNCGSRTCNCDVRDSNGNVVNSNMPCVTLGSGICGCPPKSTIMNISK